MKCNAARLVGYKVAATQLSFENEMQLICEQIGGKC